MDRSTIQLAEIYGILKLIFVTLLFGVLLIMFSGHATLSLIVSVAFVIIIAVVAYGNYKKIRAMKRRK